MGNRKVNISFKDYKKLPRLRIFITPEMRKIMNKTNVLEQTNLTSRNKYRYRKAERSLPLKYLYSNPKLFLKIIQKQPKFITHGGTRITLPNYINEDVAYLSGFICGDGNLTTTTKRDYWVSIHNKQMELLETALKIIKNIFDYKAKISNGHGCHKVEIRSMIIHSFFNKIMNIENGRKENIKIPMKIKANRNLVRAFIAGFFDAEGNVNLKRNNITCQISFCQKQKRILEEIKNELEREGIEMNLYKNQKYYVLYGNKNSLKTFSEKIPFVHPIKREKLETALRNQIN